MASATGGWWATQKPFASRVFRRLAGTGAEYPMALDVEGISTTSGRLGVRPDGARGNPHGARYMVRARKSEVQVGCWPSLLTSPSASHFPTPATHKRLQGPASLQEQAMGHVPPQIGYVPHPVRASAFNLPPIPLLTPHHCLPSIPLLFSTSAPHAFLACPLS